MGRGGDIYTTILKGKSLVCNEYIMLNYCERIIELTLEGKSLVCNGYAMLSYCELIIELMLY